MTNAEQELIEAIENFQTVSAEARAMMIMEIEDGETDEDFFEILESVLDDEIAYAEEEVVKIENEIPRIESEVEEEKKRVLPKLKKIKSEYLSLTEKLLKDYEQEISAREKQSSEKIEDTVRVEVEGEEIQAIHDFLHKTKNPPSSDSQH